MKKTIKKLESKIEDLTNENRMLRGRCFDYEEKNRKMEAKEKDKLFEDYRHLGEEEKKLFEIIRWLINPKTTEFPFSKSKEQRDDKQN